MLTAFPSDFEVWENRETTRLVAPFQHESSALLSLCNETNTRIILPAVYYAAAKQDLEATLRDIGASSMDAVTKQDVYFRFVLGREKLRQAELEHILAFLDAGFGRPGCQAEDDDAHRLEVYGAIALKATSASIPFQDWCATNAGDVGGKIGVCWECAKAIEQHIRSARLKIWKSIPVMFGLPDWTVLEAEAQED